MPRSIRFNDLERDIIRVAVHHQLPFDKVARVLNRNRTSLYKEKSRLKAAGNLEALPVEIIAEYLAGKIREG